MHYYLDGYNLLFGRREERATLEASRQEFIDELAERCETAGLTVTLVFDGHFREGESERGHYRTLEILFSGFNQTADELIIEEIAQHDSPKSCVVVTRDRDLIWRIKQLRASSETPSLFFRRLQTPKNEIAPVAKRRPEKKKKFEPVLPQKNPLQDSYEQIFEERLAKLPQPKKTKIPVVDEYKRWLTLFQQKVENEH